MTSTGVVLIGLPRMVCDLLGEIVATLPDVHIAAEVGEHQEWSSALARGDAHLVILSLAAASRSGRLVPLLCRHPRLTFIALSADGHASLYELRPRAWPLGELSTSLLHTLARRAREAPLPEDGDDHDLLA